MWRDVVKALVMLGVRALGPGFLSGRVLRTPSWHFARWLKFEHFILKLFVMKIVHAWMRKRMETVFDYKFGVSSGFCPPNFAFFLHLAG